MNEKYYEPPDHEKIGLRTAKPENWQFVVDSGIKTAMILEWKEPEGKEPNELMKRFALWCQMVMEDPKPQELAKEYGIKMRFDL